MNIVGEHATHHLQYDAPLTSDIGMLARPVSHWVHTMGSSLGASADTAEAIARARAAGGGVSTLIVPADVAWTDGDERIARVRDRQPAAPHDDEVAAAVAALQSDEPAALLVADRALYGPGLELAAGVAAAAGARLFSPTFYRRAERGAGRPLVERLPYFGHDVLAMLAEVRHLVIVGAPSPVAFFAYPGQPSDLVPEGCQVHQLTYPNTDVVAVLEALADGLGGLAPPPPAEAVVPAEESGALTVERLGRVLTARLPEGAIVADEANTAGLALYGPAQNAAPHDWLCLTGGAIGQGMPVATGAAVACPDRPVINLEADGSALYTLQALWTQAREGLDVTTVILANRSYAILNIELARLGFEEAGDNARRLLNLENPTIDFVRMAESLGVPARRVERAEDFADAFGRALREPGPQLIEAVLS